MRLRALFLSPSPLSLFFSRFLTSLTTESAGAASYATTDGTDIPEVQSKINAHFGAVTQLAIGGMFGLSQNTLLTVPLERPVFLREAATGTYGPVPYFLSKMMVEIPMMIFQAALMYIVSCKFLSEDRDTLHTQLIYESSYRLVHRI